MDVTRYGLGVRGIDYIQKIGGANLQNPTTSEAYPVYDGHGNMVATLAKSTTLPTLANQRTYDAWGAVRAGSATGEPKGRYVANLGHVQDDESGLVYMRARYYEPMTGRFASEDPAMDGLNWYSYVSNNPINGADLTGRRGLRGGLVFLLGPLAVGFLFIASTVGAFVPPGTAKRILIYALLEGACLSAMTGFHLTSAGHSVAGTLTMMFLEFVKIALTAIAEALNHSNSASGGITAVIYTFYTAEAIALLGMCFYAMNAGDPALEKD